MTQKYQYLLTEVSVLPAIIGAIFLMISSWFWLNRYHSKLRINKSSTAKRGEEEMNKPIPDILTLEELLPSYTMCDCLDSCYQFSYFRCDNIKISSDHCGNIHAFVRKYGIELVPPQRYYHLIQLILVAIPSSTVMIIVFCLQI